MNEKTETPEKEYAKGLFCSLLAECNETGICDACENVKTAFLAGTKWQAEQDQETIELAEDHAFLAGADWQKEQMMKEAVEGEVRKDGTIGYFEFSNEQQFHSLLEKFQDGDRIRIIIVKED